MNEKEKYLKIWQNAVNKASEALRNGNIDEYDKFHQAMEDAAERYREAMNFENSTNSSKFGVLNATIESVIPSLFIKNKKLVKECINLIKNDKNLLGQYKFYNALKKYSSDADAKSYLSESLELATNGINRKTLNESNKKLADFIIKNNLRPKNEINEDEKKFMDSCDYLIEHKKSLSNLVKYSNNIDIASKYIAEHKKDNEVHTDLISMAENVEKKMNMLNEAERDLVRDIMAVKGNVAEAKRKKLFDNMKNECVKKINSMIEESDSDERSRLINLKETILMKEYNKDSAVTDIAKLLEIGAVLSDK